MKKIISLFVFTLFFISCKEEKKEESVKIPKVNQVFNQLLKSYNDGKLALNPIKATFAGDYSYNNQFPNYLSDTYQNKKKEFFEQYKKKALEFKEEDLTETQKMSKAVLVWDCDMALAQASFKNDILFPINQMWTVNLKIGQFASGSSSQPFKTVKDYENWLQRLEKYNIWLQTAEKRMKQGIEENYVLPKSLIKKIIPQFEELSIDKDITAHLFYSPIKNFPKDFSEEEKKKLTEAYTSFLNTKLIPSYKSLSNLLKNDYLKAGRESSGISAIPNGKEYYQHAIKNYTTTNMTADEIHELGLQEVARILSEMEKVKEQVKFKGSLKEFFNYVRNNKE